jgi:hypothetical protein
MSASQLQPRKSGQPDRLADSTPDCLLTASQLGGDGPCAGQGLLVLQVRRLEGHEHDADARESWIGAGEAVEGREEQGRRTARRR